MFIVFAINFNSYFIIVYNNFIFILRLWFTYICIKTKYFIITFALYSKTAAKTALFIYIIYCSKRFLYNTGTQICWCLYLSSIYYVIVIIY